MEGSIPEELDEKVRHTFEKVCKLECQIHN